MGRKLLSLILSFVVLCSGVLPVFGAGTGDREASVRSYTGTPGDTDLLFEFDNRTKDQERYAGAAYGGYNFDRETEGYWATAYNGSYTAYSIVNSGGTLRVHVTEDTDKGGTYGPWIKVTNTYGKLPNSNPNTYDYYPLNFDPSGVKNVTIRFKLVNCTVPDGKIPEIVFEYYTLTGETYGYGNDMKAVYTFRNQEYMTVSIPVSSKLTNADELKGFGFRFRNVKGNTSGKLTVDYIRIASEGIREPLLEEGFKLGHSLNLASDISVNLALAASALEGFDMETVYAECRYYDYEGNEKGEEVLVTLEPRLKGEYYYFVIEGLTAVHMTNELRTVLYGTKDGQTYYSPTDVYTIADYAYSQLGKANTPASLKTLCADLLRYGGAIQSYKGYRTDTPADRNMTPEQRAYLRDTESLTFGTLNQVGTELSQPSVVWAGKSLDLQARVGIKYIVDLSAYEGDPQELSLQASYVDYMGQPRTETVETIEVYKADRKLYAFTFTGLLAAELRTPVTVQVMAGDTPLSNTLQYRADTYGNGKSGQLLEVCKALFAYSDSALAYFKE